MDPTITLLLGMAGAAGYAVYRGAFEARVWVPPWKIAGWLEDIRWPGPQIMRSEALQEIAALCRRKKTDATSAVEALLDYYMENLGWGVYGDREEILAILETTPVSFKSLEQLDRVQEKAERACMEWMAAQPQGPSKDKARVRHSFAGFVQTVAVRKAEVAKRKDGELLAGQTIKVPQRRDRQMYRMVGIRRTV